MSCPICNSDSTFVYMKGIFDCESTEVIECNECGLQYLYPKMTEEEEENYYLDYYHSQQVRHFENNSLKDMQHNSVKHYQQYQNIYDTLINNAESILEIGSGSGGFLNFVKDNYPAKSITSVEISKSNLEFLRDPNLNNFSDIKIYSDIEELENNKFDLIFAHGVLEHVRSPKEFLCTLKGLLKGNDSQMAFNIPNKNIALNYMYESEEFKKFIYMKQHYHTFTEKSLEVIAKQIGCTVKGYNYMQVWGLDNTVSWLRYKKPKNFDDYTKFFSQETLSSYNSDLIKNKLTDLFMVVFKR